MNKKIAIAFTIGDSYAQHCCVTMVSILENNPDCDFDFYVLTDYFSDKNRNLSSSK